MKRFLRECICFAAMLLLSGVQIGMVNSVFGAGQAVHLIFIVAIGCAILDREHRAMGILLFGGVVLDWYSALPFGLFLLSYSAGMAVFLFFQRTIFKQRAVHFYVMNTAIAAIATQTVFTSAIFLSQKLHWLGGVTITMPAVVRQSLWFISIQPVAVLIGVLFFGVLRRYMISRQSYAQKSI